MVSNKTVAYRILTLFSFVFLAFYCFLFMNQKMSFIPFIAGTLMYFIGYMDGVLRLWAKGRA